LRIYGLSQESLWLDEGFTARRAGNTFLELASEFHHQTQSALYYFGIKLWCMVFGASEFSLRLPSALFGIAAVLVIFLLARQLFSENVALWSAFFLAVNPFAIYYSQEARPYALLMLAVTLSLYYLLMLSREYNRTRMLGYLISTLVALYSHPMAPLILGLEVFTVYLYRQSTEAKTFNTTVLYPLKAIGIAGLLYLPQVFFMWQTMADKIKGRGSAQWIPRPDASALVQTACQYFMALPLAEFAGLTILCAVAMKPRWDRQSGRALALLLAQIACFIGGLWIISLTITPVYVDRYTIPALPAVMILLGWAIAKFSPFLRTLAAVIFIGLTVYTLHGYYSGSDKDPYREATAIVSNQVRSGDVIVMHAAYARDVFNYYFQAPEGVRVISPYSYDEIPAGLHSAKRIFVVRSYALRTRTKSDSLLARITDGYITGAPIEIHGWADRNPWAYWVADIQVTPYYSPTTNLPNESRQ
jgi:mannosyltransferase